MFISLSLNTARYKTYHHLIREYYRTQEEDLILKVGKLHSFIIEVHCYLNASWGILSLCLYRSRFL